MSSNDRSNNNSLSVKPVEQIAPDGHKVTAYPAWYLILLWIMGHKIAPTFANSKQFNYDGLATEEEYTQFPAAKNVMQLIYLNPNFWSIERIQKEAWRFEGVRSLPGPTYIRDENGQPISDLLIHCILDIDSEKVYNLCLPYLKNDWINNTYVTKTYDDYCYRIDWHERYNPETNDFTTIGTLDCKSDQQVFELMIGRQYQQIAGKHRDHLNSDFTYTHVGCQSLAKPAIMIRDGMYDQIVNTILKDLIFIDEVNGRRKKQAKSHDVFHSSSSGDATASIYENDDYVDLDEWQIEPIVSWACKFYGLHNHYNYFMLAFLGTLAWYRYSHQSVCKVIDLICEKKGELGANTKGKWYDTSKRAYERLAEGLEVAGEHKLRAQIQRNLSKADPEGADKEVNNLIAILTKGNQYTSNPRSSKHKKEYEIPDKVISVSEAIKQSGDIHRVEGIISGIEGKLYKLILKAGYRCLDCGTINEGRISEIAADEIRPNLFQYLKSPSKCVNCGEKELYLDDDNVIYSNVVVIELRNKNDYSEVDTIRVALFDNLQNDIANHLGEAVEIIGNIYVLLEPGRGNWKRYPFLYANSIKYDNTDVFEISDADTVEIHTLVDEQKENIVNFLAEERFAIDIIGCESIKKGLLLSAASTSLDIEKDKLHTALLGDPGKAKSLLLRRVIELVNNSVFQSAQNASGLSLTVIVDYVNGVHIIRLGVIPMARGGICALNEGGGMYFKHQVHLLDCMEEQFFSYAKYGLKGKVLSPTVIVWSSNPQSGKFQDPDKIDMEEFPALKALIDRFGLIFILRDKIDLKEDEEYGRIKLANRNAKDEFVEKRKKYTLFLKKYIEYSKRFDPVLSEEATEMINTAYCEIRSKEYGSPRILDDLILISTMIAQLKLKNIVDGRDVEEAQELFNEVLKPLGQIINVSTDPINTLVSVCLEILKTSQIPKTLHDLLQEAAADLIIVKYKYLIDGIKKNNWRIINEAFLRLSDRKNVRILSNNPRTLIWEEKQQAKPLINTSPDNETPQVPDPISDAKNIDATPNIDTPRAESPVLTATKESSSTEERNNSPLRSTNQQFHIPNTQKNISEKNQNVMQSACEIVDLSGESLQKNVLTSSTNQVAVIESKKGDQAPFEDTYQDLRNAAGFDCEWHFENGKEGVYCACFYPFNGQPIKLHVEDFDNDEGAFIDKVIDTLQQFNLIVGHNLLGRNSDLDQVSMMYYTKSNLADKKVKFQRLESIKSKIIDTYNVFKLQYIEDSLAANGIEYESHSLNDIAKAYLGKEKLGGLTGTDIEDLSKEEQLEYCLMDAEIAFELINKENWDVVQTLWNINTIAQMNFIDLCNVDYVSNIGEKILISLGYSNVNVPRYLRDNKVDYSGGEVITPVRGIHKNVILLDCKSMYPTIVVKYKLSSETINCVCCRDDLTCRLPIEVMEELNNGLIAKGSKPVDHIWVCKNRKGIFAELERKLIGLKDEAAAKGEMNRSKAMKLVANSLYGMFQLMFFKFVDQRIGWIITAFGRTIIKTLERESVNYGLTPIYGDTDSIFVKPGPESRLEEFIQMADTKYRARLAIDKEWKSILLKAKKAYLGITKDDKFIFKKMHGLKDDSTPQQTQLVKSIVRRETLELFETNKQQLQAQLLDTVRRKFKELEDNISNLEYIEKNLVFSFTASAPLDQYKGNVVQTVIATELLAEGRSIAAGNKYRYYKIKPIKYKDANGKRLEKKIFNLSR